MGWTLQTGGVTKSFADWGLINPRRRVSSFDGGTVTVEQPTARGVDEAIVAYLGTVVIAVDGVTVFTGLRTGLKRKGSGEVCGLVYEFRHAATYYLEKLPYQQEWFSGDTTDVMLHVDDDGNYIRSGEQIGAVIAWAAGCGAPIAAGTIEAGIYLPIDQQTDRFCMEIIQQEARWSPDAIGFFDDAQSPAVFHFKRAADLEGLTVALPTDRTRWEVTPRDDLVLPAVKIIFKRANQVDGQVSYQFATDVSPEGATGRELGALVQTMDLEGVRISKTIAEIETELLTVNPEDAEGLEFWRRRIPALRNTGWQNVELSFVGATDRESGEEADLGALPYVLLSGQLSDTMTLEDGETAVEWQKVRLQLRVTADQTSSGGETCAQFSDDHFVDCVITNAPSGEYVVASEEDSGEPLAQFAGMAAYLHAARSTVQHEGFVTLTEVEVGELLRDNDALALKGWLGHRLNLTGGRAEWATMNAVIQSVEEDWTSGQVTLRFGPVNKGFSFDNLKELVRANRNRRRRNSVQARTTGSAEEGSTALGKETPDNVKHEQGPEYSYLKVLGAEAIELKSETGEVNIGEGILIRIADAGDKVIRLREYTFCYRDPTTGVSSQKRVVMLGSEFYG
jgi:hypothetical protein